MSDDHVGERPADLVRYSKTAVVVFEGTAVVPAVVCIFGLSGALHALVSGDVMEIGRGLFIGGVLGIVVGLATVAGRAPKTKLENGYVMVRRADLFKGWCCIFGFGFLLGASVLGVGSGIGYLLDWIVQGRRPKEIELFCVLFGSVGGLVSVLVGCVYGMSYAVAKYPRYDESPESEAGEAP